MKHINKRLMVLLLIFTMVVQTALSPQVQAETRPALLENVLSNALVTMNINGTEVDLSQHSKSIEATSSSTVNLSYTWSIDDSVDLSNGAYTEVKIPNVFIPRASFDGVITYGADQIGTYHLDASTKLLRMNFDSKLNDLDERHGDIKFELRFDLNEFSENVSQLVQFNELVNKNFTISLKPIVAINANSKIGTPDSTVNAKNIIWKVNVNQSLESFTSARVEDTIPTGLKLDVDSIQINRLNIGYNGTVTLGDTVYGSGAVSTVSGSAVSVSGGATTNTGNDLKIELGRTKEAYQISYKTDVIDPTVTSFINKAVIMDNDLQKGEVVATVTTTMGKTIEKSGYKVNNENKISWSIDINKGEIPLNHAIIQETLPPGLTLDTSSIRLYKLTKSGSVWTASEESSILPSSEVANTFSIDLGDINTTAYRITYLTDIDYGTEYIKDVSYTNAVVLFNGVKEIGDSDAKVEFFRPEVLEKVGSHKEQYGVNIIDWTVTVNSASHPITNAIVKDTLPPGLALSGSVVIKDQNGNIIADWVAAGISVSTASRIEIAFGDINSKYTIQYSTTINDYSVASYKNGVRLTGGGIGLGVSKEFSITPSISNKYTKSIQSNYNGPNRITYNGIDYDMKTMSWRLRIRPYKSKVKGLVINDTFPNNGLYLLEDTVVVIKGTGKTIVPNTDYIIEPKKNPLDSSERGFQYGFTIKFNSDYIMEGSEYNVYYKTSFDPDNEHILNNTSKTYVNKAVFSGTTIDEDMNALEKTFNVQASAQYDVTDIAFNTGSKSGTLTKLPQRRMTWVLKVNHLARNINSLSIKDTYSEGQKLDLESIVVTEYKVNSSGGENVVRTLNQSEYTVSEDEAQRSFIINFNDIITTPHKITYSTDIYGVSRENYINEAIVTADGIDSPFKSTVSYSEWNNFIKKNATNIEDGKVYTDDEIAWELNVNSSLSQLSSATIEDTISAGLILDHSSIIVKNQNTGAVLEKDKDYSIVITSLSDGRTKMQFAFLYEIKNQFLVSYNTIVSASSGNVSNEAIFSADNITTTSVPMKSYSASQNSSATGIGKNKGNIKIIKTDDATGAVLNAKFRLYYVLNGDERIVGGEDKTTVNGKVS